MFLCVIIDDTSFLEEQVQKFEEAKSNFWLEASHTNHPSTYDLIKNTIN
jgi:hypothetical protein